MADWYNRLKNARQSWRDNVSLDTRHKLRNVGQGVANYLNPWAGKAYAAGVDYSYNPSSGGGGWGENPTPSQPAQEPTPDPTPTRYSNYSTADYTDPTPEPTPEPEPVQPPPYSQMFMGSTYSDPTSYYNAVRDAAVTEFNRQNKMLNEAYQAGLLDFGEYQKQLTQARENVKTQYGEAMGAISGRFSALSPDAYQSSQGKAEVRANDITNQNYSNIASQEANLGLQKTNYQRDYENKLEANRLAQQTQIDNTYNATRDSLADTPYANALDSITAPKLNTMKPMDNSILGVYDNLAQLQAGGNVPAIRQTIDGLQVEQPIKDWLYTRFLPQQI